MTTDDLTFANALRYEREARRLSQSRLALLAGFDHSYISRMEAGNREPSRDAVLSVAAAMDLDAAGRDGLLLAAGFGPIDPAAILAAEPDAADIFAALCDARLPDEYREALRLTLRMLAGQARMHAAALASVDDRDAA